jgi:hypothetical protein
MAARSPVTIESSPSIDAYRAPTITPDSPRRSVSTNSITRSSPQLLSPSSFVRPPRVQPLKSGSRAQQVPAGANAGFASAASIWKGQSKDDDAQERHGNGTEDLALADNLRARRGSEPAAKSAGKLTKPRKALKVKKPSSNADAGPESPRFDSFVELKEVAANPLAKEAESQRARAVDLQGDAIGSRRPSINLSEYSFHAEPAPAQLPLPAKDETATKKSVRKRASKPAKSCEVPATKKTRKCTPKSEAIILDSDEPEEALVAAEAVDMAKVTIVSEPVAKKPRPRKPKQSMVNKSTGEDGTAITSQVTKKDKVAAKSTEASTEKSVYFDQQPPTIELERLPSSPPPVAFQTTSHVEAHVDADKMAAADLVADASLPPAESEPAPRRRRSWTPAKDSFAKNTMNTLPVVTHEPDENMQQVPFSALLGNFSYMHSEIAPVQRAPSGEASTKRRRIELSDQVAIPALQALDTPKAKAAPKAVKTAKKPKAIPKKPQTVTALALAAYQPPKDPDPAQSTVSTYFAPQKDVELPLTEPDVNGQEVVAKVKKPRKSRAKVPSADGDAVVAKKATKPRAKTTKVKVKFDKEDHQAPLYSPTQACKQIRSQDFIFGTSSQLAADESSGFVRDMQLAIQQSEITCALPNSSQIGTQLDLSAMDEGMSCARVPTAPHGTCLSVEQASRELWRVGARDSTGSKLANEPSLPLPIEFSAADEEPIVRVIDITSLSSSGREGHGQLETVTRKPSDSQTRSASANADKPLQASEDAQPDLHTSLDMAEHDPQVDAESAKSLLLVEDWMYLGSDDSVIIPHAIASKLQDRSHNSVTSLVRRTALQPLDVNISMVASDPIKNQISKVQAHAFSTTAATFDRDRLRMQPLTVGVDSGSSTVLSPKRGPGRPRKDSSLERSAQTSPARGRGRPRKISLVDKASKTSPVRGRGRPRKEISPDRAGSMSPKRPVGRPRKENTVARPDLSPPKRPVDQSRDENSIGRLASRSPNRPVGRPRKNDSTHGVPSLSPSRPVGRPRKEPTVVQISSSSPAPPLSQPIAASVTGRLSPKMPRRPVERPRQEAATTTLSPRAFRKVTSPPKPSASQPVSRKEWTRIDEISDSDAPLTPSPRRRRASSSPAIVRPLDFDLPRSPSAMPKVAVPGNAAIKATDASWPAIQTSIFPQIAQTIKAAPIGEDMTAPSWYEKILLYDPIVLEDLTAWLNAQGLRTEIKRLKHKTKTRGRKKKDASPEVDEWEVVRDELKAWMVQKWCEENSICCLWKEGLRGGVKARY